MLDADTKRRIDSARDILVGKVPDPKSQVEQITIALIYKFMNDMDAEAEALGGKRKFFAGKWARYGWPKLMRSGLGGHEVLNLYGEAITRMPENPGIPMLFRDIFKNAYLPYRDPETLKSFLKIIDEFEYGHSESLGDAFEYLLSVLGSQGDAGQFRTPRHIIDFMVKVINPKKNESVLDPACGTAGFLISAYKHILRNNKDKKGNNTLTPDEKGRLANNLMGYDISPDMVRLSLVNLYLHGFIDPHIDEYDTLTSEDKWNEYADVILANPPFMSPKGGIKPHKRFSIQAKRSEVLFVDYMAEHLTPAGRAAIIVPEGIIFQSQTAYKQLRKMLVDEYLVAVVSLPAGVFQPYSGVKTSILILDKLLSKRTNEILFLKVNNDGTDLGARRKAVSNSDLPDAMNAYRKWTATFTAEEHEISIENLPERLALVVPKAKILADGDFDLTFEQYRDARPTTDGAFPMARIGDLVSETSTRVRDNEVPVWSVSNALGFVNTGEYFSRQVASKDIANYKIVGPYGFAYNPSRLNVGSIALNSKGENGAVSPMYVVFNVSDDTLSPDYLFMLLKSAKLNSEFNRVAQGGVRVQVRFKALSKIQIPLPPLEVQKEIVAEQALVTANRELIKRMEQKIQTTLARIWDEEGATTAKAKAKANPPVDSVKTQKKTSPKPTTPTLPASSTNAVSPASSSSFKPFDKLLIMSSKNTFTRSQAAELRRRLKEPRRFIQVVSGARQVGKTTMVLQVAERNQLPYHFASADEPTLRGNGWIETQWEQARLLASKPRKRNALLILDEVQKVPHWEETVKRLWDEDSRKKILVKVVLLRSAPLLVGKELTESLAGRFEILHLPHWSFSEMRQAFGWDLKQYLFYGAYPGAAPLIKQPSRWARYLIETTVARDVLLPSRVDKPALMRQLFDLGCGNSGQIISHTKMMKQILSYTKMMGQLQDAGNTTRLAHYLDLLAGAGVLTGLPKYADQPVRRRGSSPKLQVTNTALMTAQSGLTYAEAFADKTYWGRVTESAVGAHLVNAAAQGNCQLFYWREGNHEVDFVLRRGRKLVAIEVKSGNLSSTLPGMDAFARKFKPTRKLLVGADGISLEEFLSTPVHYWLT